MPSPSSNQVIEELQQLLRRLDRLDRQERELLAELSVLRREGDRPFWRSGSVVSPTAKRFVN